MTLAACCCNEAPCSTGRNILLAIEGLEPPAISQLIDLAESYVLLNRSAKTQRDLLRGRILINLFFVLRAIR